MEPPKTGETEYEFNDQQNKVIGELANSMAWVAGPILGLGLLYGAVSVLTFIEAFYDPRNFLRFCSLGIASIIMISLGKWTKEGSKAFQSVVATQGNDISHLMSALDSLRKKYGALSTFIKIFVAIVLLSLIVGAVTFAIDVWNSYAADSASTGAASGGGPPGLIGD